MLMFAFLCYFAYFYAEFILCRNVSMLFGVNK